MSEVYIDTDFLPAPPSYPPYMLLDFIVPISSGYLGGQYGLGND
jgi:hypothetical protein